jgi:anti-anti-sigma factor
MTINVNWMDGELRIVVEGDIDERGAEQLKERFREWQRHDTRQVTVDLAQVTHIGSAGIGKLLVLYKDLAARDARLALVNVPAAIYALLCEMRLNVLFSISKASPSSR